MKETYRRYYHYLMRQKRNMRTKWNKKSKLDIITSQSPPKQHKSWTYFWYYMDTCEPYTKTVHQEMVSIDLLFIYLFIYLYVYIHKRKCKVRKLLGYFKRSTWKNPKVYIVEHNSVINNQIECNTGQ